MGFLSLVLGHLYESTGTVRAALDLVLRRKAIGAEALAAQRDAVLSGRYPALELDRGVDYTADADRTEDLGGA